jgi:hypothetical protein
MLASRRFAVAETSEGTTGLHAHFEQGIRRE